MTLLYRTACTYATEGKPQHNLVTNDGSSFRLNASTAYSYKMLVKLYFQIAAMSSGFQHASWSSGNVYFTQH